MRFVYSTLFVLLVSTLAFSQAANSIASGNWNSTSTWDCACIPSNTNGAITINSGHIVTVTANANGDQMTIVSGGTLVINSGINFTVWTGSGDDLTVNGTVTIQSTGVLTIRNAPAPPPPQVALVRVNGTINNSGSIANASSSTLIFQAGAAYNHLYSGAAGTVPSASWNSTSTVSIQSDPTAAPSGLGQSFGNFVWDTPSLSSFIDLNGALTTVNGNCTFQNIPASYLYLTSTSNYTLNVGGNFTVDNSYVGLNSTATATINVTGNALFSNNNDLNPTFDGDLTLNVTGNLEFQGGTTNMTYGGAGSIPINVGGNFTLSSSPVINNGGAGTYTLTFNGSGTQNYNANQEFTDFSYVIQNGSRVDVANGNYFSGSGNFTLAAGGTLGVAGSNGLVTGTSQGNVRVSGTRTYNANSNIIYNGSIAQNLGNEWGGSGALNGVAVNLEIANSAGVTNNIIGSTSLVGNLTLTSGSFNIGNSNTLQIQSNFDGNGGTIGGLSTSNLSFSGSGSISGSLNFTSGQQNLNNFTINRAGTINLGTNLTINGTLSFASSGNLNFDQFNGQTLTIAGDMTQTGSGGLVSGTNFPSNLAINGSGALTAIPFCTTCGSMELNNLTFNRSSGTYTWNASVSVLSNVNLNSGTLTHSSGLTMTTGSNFNRSAGATISAAPLNTGAYNVLYNGNMTTGPELPVNATALNNLSIAGDVTLNSSITVNGVLTLTSGTFSAGTNSIDMRGNFVSNSASSLTSSSVTFSGNTTVSGISTPTFGSITVTGTLTPNANFNINGNLTNNGTINSGTATVTFGGNTTISGSNTCSFNNVVISGTLTAPTGGTINVAGNWTNNGTFNSSTSTVVFSGTSSIAGSSSTTFRNITISGTLNSPSTLTLTGNFTNNGTFNRGSGTVVFSGTATQLIQGTVVTDFNNITINNTAGPPGVRVASNQNLRGILTLANNVIFDPDGTGGTTVFRLMSSADDPTQDASIAALGTGAQVQGNVTVQRYMAIEGANSNRIYRYISSPVQSAPVSQIQTFIPVTGSFTGTSSCSGCGSSQSMFLYNEAVITGDLNAGYEDFPATANSETLAEGRGYAIFVRGNIPPVSSAGSALFELRGSIFSGSRTLPVSFTSSGTLANDGWNLVGNPYPATIDWDAASGWTRNFINNAIYMRDNGLATPVIASYVGGVGVNGGSRYIPIGQAFFVKSDGGGTPSLQVTEAVKVAGTQSTFFKVGEIDDLLRITLRQGSVKDETAVRFLSVATDAYDPEWDAYKMKNATFNFSSLIENGKQLAINAMPSLDCGRTINFDVSDIVAGAYGLDFSGMDSFDESVTMTFTDSYTNTTIDLGSASIYDFEVTSDPASFGANRFSITFTLADIPPVSFSTGNVCENASANVVISNSMAESSYVIKKNGSVVVEATPGNGSDLTLSIDASQLSSGINEFVLEYGNLSCPALTYSSGLTIEVENIPVVSIVSQGMSCNAGQIELQVDGGSEGNYRWYESLEATTPIEGADGAAYTTPVLDKSRTFYVSAVNSLGCEGDRIAIEANVTNYDEVTVAEQEGLLVSSYETGNQWFLDGEAIEGATAKTYKPEESGYYEVRIAIGTCETRAGREFTVTGLEDLEGVELNVYPNPVLSKLTIETSRQTLQFEVVDLLGRSLGRIRLTPQGQHLQGEFDMSSEANGTYLLKVVDEFGKVYSKRILKK